MDFYGFILYEEPAFESWCVRIGEEQWYNAIGKKKFFFCDVEIDLIEKKMQATFSKLVNVSHVLDVWKTHLICNLVTFVCMYICMCIFFSLKETLVGPGEGGRQRRTEREGKEGKRKRTFVFLRFLYCSLSLWSPWNVKGLFI